MHRDRARSSLRLNIFVCFLSGSDCPTGKCVADLPHCVEKPFVTKQKEPDFYIENCSFVLGLSTFPVAFVVKSETRD
jgi:hypothetical protein